MIIYVKKHVKTMIYFTNFYPHIFTLIHQYPSPPSPVATSQPSSQPLPPRRSSIWTAVFGCATAATATAAASAASAATATAVATSGGSGSAAEAPAFVAGNGLRRSGPLMGFRAAKKATKMVVQLAKKIKQ